jgi:hypothetical protein
MHKLFDVVMQTSFQEYECQWIRSRVMRQFLVDLEVFYVAPAPLCHTLSHFSTNCCELLFITAGAMAKLFAWFVVYYIRTYYKAVRVGGGG